MRLAFITQDFPPEIGGIQTYSLEIARRIYKRCDDFMVIAPDKPDADEIDRDLPFDVYRIGCRNTLLGIASIPTMPAVFKRRNISTTFHAQWQTLLLSVVARKAGIIENITVAAHAREFYFNPFGNRTIPGRGYEWYKHYLLKHSDHFFPVSHYTAGILQDHGVRPGDMDVVINGTNPDLFYPLEPEPLKEKYGYAGKKIILTITRLINRKGVDTVLRAVALLAPEIPELHYIVVGEGEFGEELQKLAAALDIAERVSFVGKVPYPKVPEYYNLSDLYVMPSKTVLPEVEAFGIVFLEANACGKPAIGSKTGGIADAIIDGETGLLVEEQNPGELAEAVKKLLQDEEWRKKLGRQGRKRVLDEANWDHVAEELITKMELINKQPMR